MSLKSNGLLCFLLCSMTLSGSAFAGGYTVEPPQSSDSFELIGGAGVAQLAAGDGELGVTSSETDKLVDPSNDWNTFAAQLGLGYLHYFGNAYRYPAHTEWFPSAEPQLNAYYLGKNNIYGNVWRFNSSNFNQLTYAMPFESIRAMADLALTIVSKQWISLYGIGGVGYAWNNLGYTDSDNGGTSCPNQVLNLNSHTNGDFSWEAGGGLNFLLGDDVSLFVEYLYVDLGKGQSSANGTSGTITAPVISPASVDLSAQTGLIGLHVAI